eukprot:TRINITY_DN3170_c0_g2_i1.p1 TRINITY_DN3170_c0_g2~~TRINITY_DN3170_c0_g2_i1.p1  ORF type:complete len:1507 (-),score=561.16 TRINITY_DN3170_c0_g2_i1:79-4599(-)
MNPPRKGYSPGLITGRNSGNAKIEENSRIISNNPPNSGINVNVQHQTHNNNQGVNISGTIRERMNRFDGGHQGNNVGNLTNIKTNNPHHAIIPVSNSPHNSVSPSLNTLRISSEQKNPPISSPIHSSPPASSYSHSSPFSSPTLNNNQSYNIKPSNGPVITHSPVANNNGVVYSIEAFKINSTSPTLNANYNNASAGRGQGNNSSNTAYHNLNPSVQNQPPKTQEINQPTMRGKVAVTNNGTSYSTFTLRNPNSPPPKEEPKFVTAAPKRNDFGNGSPPALVLGSSRTRAPEDIAKAQNEVNGTVGSPGTSNLPPSYVNFDWNTANNNKRAQLLSQNSSNQLTSKSPQMTSFNTSNTSLNSNSNQNNKPTFNNNNTELNPGVNYSNFILSKTSPPTSPPVGSSYVNVNALSGLPAGYKPPAEKSSPPTSPRSDSGSPPVNPALTILGRGQLKKGASMIQTWGSKSKIPGVVMPHEVQSNALKKRFSQYISKESVKWTSDAAQKGEFDDWLEGEDSNTFGASIYTPQGSFMMDCCKGNQTVGQFKKYLLEVVMGLTLTDRSKDQYILCVDGNDYLVDDNDTLYNLGYIHFCRKLNMMPIFVVKEMSELKLFRKTIGALIGRPNCWKTADKKQITEFKRAMVKIRYEKYLRQTAPSDSTMSADSYSLSFNVKVYLNAGTSKMISGKASDTVADLVDAIFMQHAKLIEPTATGPIDASKYAMKFRGIEEYLIDFGKMLIEIKTIQEQLRTKDRVELVVLPISDIVIPNWFKLTDYYDKNKFASRTEFLQDSIIRPINEPLGVNSRMQSVFKTRSKFRVVLGKITNFNQALDEAGIKVDPRKGIRTWVEITVLHKNDTIYHTTTNSCPFYGGNFPAFHPVELCEYNKVTHVSTILFAFYCATAKKKVCILWVNIPLVDYQNVVIDGYKTSYMWNGEPSFTEANSQPTEGASITFEIKSDSGLGTLYIPDLMPPFKTAVINPSPDEMFRLNALFKTDPLYPPTKEERDMLWKFKGYCRTVPHSVLKFVWAIPWGEPQAVEEAYSLLADWPLLNEASNALELLKPRFADKKIREYTVRNLERISDNELSDYLLQLVQAMKHEMHPDSALARFLLGRALSNRNQIGHPFFWFLKAQLDTSLSAERYEMLLEAFLEGCGNFKEELFKQTSMGDSLMKVAIEVASNKVDRSRKKAVLVKGLEEIQLPPSFQTIINPAQVAKGIRIEKCKFMDSKTVPIWVEFENVDSFGDSFSAILKVGDDLRQDQLTLQMMSIMDNLWRKEGLDMRMIRYKVVATGPDMGWVEVVEDSTTCAWIQAQAGGISRVFDEKILAQWIRQQNPSDQAYSNAVDAFLRSCAASCVSTYVLGIGDRHNDNIMINKSGQLFHIDFGKFLGNPQKFLNISRDRAPFVFTPDMAYVMGGIGSENYNTFVNLCCKAYNVVRKNANIFINLFAMMLETGIPELQSEKDLDYVMSAFALNLTEEEAQKHFTGLISKSLNEKSIQLNFAMHLLAKPG